jgi:hypothetical protein
MFELTAVKIVWDRGQAGIWNLEKPKKSKIKDLTPLFPQNLYCVFQCIFLIVPKFLAL